MDGKAMFTTVASSEAIPEPSTVTASTQRPGAEETRKEGTAIVLMPSDAAPRGASRRRTIQMIWTRAVAGVPEPPDR